MAAKATSKRAKAPTPHSDELLARPSLKKAVPIDHDQMESEAEETTEDPGDLEKETLDARAPFNKTYGREC
jgi:hypothetical protein